jgi:hypothetical protein
MLSTYSAANGGGVFLVGINQLSSPTTKVKNIRKFNLSTPSMSPQHGAYTCEEHSFSLYHKCEVFTVYISAVHTTVCKYNTTLNRSDKNNNEKHK